MKRHLVLPVVAAATAGLLLTSCSGGDSEPDDDIAGVQSPSPSEEPEDDEPEEPDDAEDTPDDGIDRPEIELPDDLENVFEPAEEATSEELAVLADQERYIAAVDEAITSGETDRPALAFYSDGEAYFNVLDLVAGYQEDGVSIGGETRYYNRQIHLIEEGAVTTSYCVDYVNSYTVDVDSGERTPEGDITASYASRLERSDDGVWKTVSYSVEDGESQCE